MVNKKIWTVSMLVSLLILTAGCSLGNQSTNNKNNSSEPVEVVQPEENPQASEEQVMSDFNNLMANNPEINEVIQFMEYNISNVSPQNVSVMILALEDLQVNHLPTFEENFTSSEDLQVKLRDLFKGDTSNIENITDTDIKTLLEETKNSGYKIETAEGFYFPIIDYQFYKTFSAKATEEIQNYIEIMAVESNQVPAKDAALMISWNEIVDRALEQEAFLKQYPNSERLNEVTELYKRYEMFTFFGLNNTPLFSYDTKKIDPEAKAVYLDAISREIESDYTEMLGSFLDVLEKNNDTLTDEVDAFRKDLTKFQS